MSAAEASRETKASPDVVWRIWFDTSTWPTWNPDIASVALNGPLAREAETSGARS